ncbi:MAG: hypothetical protein EAX96_19705 [Candidatus Lokiarchaeota archaeon]|nr:hypothetical protein [Candidatus Lokiarchaeota archaeon]
MKEINAIYVLDYAGNQIFSHEIQTQNDKSVDQALLNSFISAIDSFTKELGEKKANAITLSDSKIFISRDEKYGILFVIQCIQSVKDNKIFKILNKIQEIFIKNYTKFLSMAPNLREHVLSAFHKDINKILIDSGMIASEKIKFL